MAAQTQNQTPLVTNLTISVPTHLVPELYKFAAALFERKHPRGSVTETPSLYDRVIANCSCGKCYDALASEERLPWTLHCPGKGIRNLSRPDGKCYAVPQNCIFKDARKEQEKYNRLAYRNRYIYRKPLSTSNSSSTSGYKTEKLQLERERLDLSKEVVATRKKELQVKIARGSVKSELESARFQLDKKIVSDREEHRLVREKEQEASQARKADAAERKLQYQKDNEARFAVQRVLKYLRSVYSDREQAWPVMGKYSHRLFVAIDVDPETSVTKKFIFGCLSFSSVSMLLPAHVDKDVQHMPLGDIKSDGKNHAFIQET